MAIFRGKINYIRNYAKLPECPDLWSGMNGQDSVGDVFRHRQASSSVFDARTCAVKLRPLVGEVHSFASNRTAYGAIQALESVFADWFLYTRILPIITPIPIKYFSAPEMLPKDIYSVIINRGIKVYENVNKK